MRLSTSVRLPLGLAALLAGIAVGVGAVAGSADGVVRRLIDGLGHGLVSGAVLMVAVGRAPRTPGELAGKVGHAAGVLGGIALAFTVVYNLALDALPKTAWGATLRAATNLLVIGIVYALTVVLLLSLWRWLIERPGPTAAWPRRRGRRRRGEDAT